MREEIFRLPTCGWPEDPEEKIIGTWMEEMLNSGIDGILRAYQLRVAGLTMEQHQVCSTIPWSFLPVIHHTIGAYPAWLHTESSITLQNKLGLSLTLIIPQAALIPVRRDLRNRDYHTYMNFHVVYGRKPETDTSQGLGRIPESTEQEEQT